MPKINKEVHKADQPLEIDLEEVEPKNDEENDNNFGVYVGSETGVLKGVSFGADIPTLKNFHTFKQDGIKSEIQSLSWMDESEKELCVAFKDKRIKIYNTKLRAFTSGVNLDVENKYNDEGNVVRVFNYKKLAEPEEGEPEDEEPTYHGHFLVGFDSGKILLWRHLDEERVLQFSVGKHLSAFRQSLINPSIFATGGKDNDLKIWDLNWKDPTQPTFKAKNLPHDNLDLKVPIWPQDLVFMPGSSELIGLCSRYGHVRFYDPKVNNRGRPVINMNFVDHALMAISATSNNRQVVVGSAQGKLGLIDFRNPKGSLVHLFRGVTGSIRSIHSATDGPHFVACGLDRHLYLYNFENTKPLKKLYLKSRLNCAIMANDFSLDHVFKDQDSAEIIPEAWQNISMEVLDTGSFTTPKAKKMKKN